MQDLIIGSVPLLIAIVASLLLYKQVPRGWLRLLPVFLLFTFVVQLGGYYYSKTFKKSNHFIFNGYTVVAFLFYFFLFYDTQELKQYRKWLLPVLLIFIVTFLLKSFVWGSFFIYNSLVNNVGELLIFCCCLTYFYELLRAERWSHYFSIPMFWITTGIVFASVSDFVYLSVFNYIMDNKLDPNGVIYGVITTTSSIIEYGLFTVAFLCKRIWTKAK